MRLFGGKETFELLELDYLQVAQILGPRKQLEATAT